VGDLEGREGGGGGSGTVRAEVGDGGIWSGRAGVLADLGGAEGDAGHVDNCVDDALVEVL